MKTLKINGISEKVTKKAIKDAIQTDLRLDFGKVARSFQSVLIMTVRDYAYYHLEFALLPIREQVNFAYDNIEKLIRNAALHYIAVANYFGLPFNG